MTGHRFAVAAALIGMVAATCPRSAGAAAASPFSAIRAAGATAGWPAAIAPWTMGGVLDRLRPLDDGARSLVAAGMARSATFREMVESVESSDLIVYVETRRQDLAGQLQFVHAATDARYLRISIDVPARETELVAWLGHELWHALEIARAPEVIDETSLTSFYRRIGSFSLSRQEVETEGAQAVQLRVLGECESRGTSEAADVERAEAPVAGGCGDGTGDGGREPRLSPAPCADGHCRETVGGRR